MTSHSTISSLLASPPLLIRRWRPVDLFNLAPCDYTILHCSVNNDDKVYQDTHYVTARYCPWSLIFSSSSPCPSPSPSSSSSDCSSNTTARAIQRLASELDDDPPEFNHRVIVYLEGEEEDPLPAAAPAAAAPAAAAVVVGVGVGYGSLPSASTTVMGKLYDAALWRAFFAQLPMYHTTGLKEVCIVVGGLKALALEFPCRVWSRHSSNPSTCDEQRMKDVFYPNIVMSRPEVARVLSTSTPGMLYIGNELHARSLSTYIDLGIACVLTIAEAMECPQSLQGPILLSRQSVTFERYPIADDFCSNLDTILELSFTSLVDKLRTGQSVLVHCHKGQSRSASVVLYFLMKSQACQLLLQENWSDGPLVNMSSSSSSSGSSNSSSHIQADSSDTPNTNNSTNNNTNNNTNNSTNNSTNNNTHNNNNNTNYNNDINSNKSTSLSGLSLYESALLLLQRKRPMVRPNEEFVKQLRAISTTLSTNHLTYST